LGIAGRNGKLEGLVNSGILTWPFYLPSLDTFFDGDGAAKYPDVRRLPFTPGLLMPFDKTAGEIADCALLAFSWQRHNPFQSTFST
jgi:hypothetical protein